MFGLFLVCWAGQLAAGFNVYNDDREQRGEAPVSFSAYATSAHALEATAENWESEFLQMAAFALLTAFLIQRGSAESKDPERDKAENAQAHLAPDSPWPVRRGGWVLRLYEHSLSICLGTLFIVSFVLHVRGGTALHNEEQMPFGEPPLSCWEFLTTAQFWFESLQNWQSEFLSIGAMVILSIFLREKGSPESKRVESPHHAHE